MGLLDYRQFKKNFNCRKTFTLLVKNKFSLDYNLDYDVINNNCRFYYSNTYYRITYEYIDLNTVNIYDLIL